MASTVPAAPVPSGALNFSTAIPVRTPSSPDLSDTLSRHMFITTVIPRPIPDAAAAIPATPQQPAASVVREADQRRMRQCLTNIGQDIREMQDFLTIGEDVLQRERERDREFYARERRRMMAHNNNNKENKLPGSGGGSTSSVSSPPLPPVTCPIYSLQSPTYKRPAHAALRKCKSAACSADDSHSSDAGGSRSRRGGARRRPSTGDVLKQMVRMRQDLVGPIDFEFMAESEIDPEYLRQHSDAEDHTHSRVDDGSGSMDMLMLSSADEQTDDSLEMVVVVDDDKARGEQSVTTEGWCGSDGDGKECNDDQRMRESSAQSNAT